MIVVCMCMCVNSKSTRFKTRIYATMGIFYTSWNVWANLWFLVYIGEIMLLTWNLESRAFYRTEFVALRNIIGGDPIG